MQLLRPFFFLKSLFTYLYLSVTSISFYRNILNKHQDYGMQYILNLSFIASLLFSIVCLYKIDQVYNYLQYGSMSPQVKILDSVLSEIPVFDYDGEKIITENKNPILISNNEGRNIVAIDPDNKLLPNDRGRVPIILAKNEILVNIIGSEGRIKQLFPIKYKDIFVNNPQTITQDVIKLNLMRFTEAVPKVIIYLIFPLIGLYFFISVLLSKALLLFTMCVFLYILKNKYPVKTSIRLMAYASGVSALLNFMVLFFPAFLLILWITQGIAYIVMVSSVLQTYRSTSLF